MSSFEYICGMVGNPILPEIEWSDQHMQTLKELGMNYSQLNIAWDNRPKNEPLNLNDIDEEVLSVLKYRVSQLQKYGMKGILHVGMPKIRILLHEANLTQYISPSCISDESTLDENVKMIRSLMEQIPEVDDYMFYTYDQHAWLCSEFGNCPSCAGVPLEDRLPQFINSFKKAMAQVNPKSIFWWQPWELSLGQIVQVLSKIDTNNFGMMLNTAGSESYYNNIDNYWLRCISYVLEERDIPFIAEVQTSGSGVGTVPLQRFPCPTLVHRQIELMKCLPGFTGIKEHFGYAMSKLSCNMLFLKEYLKDTYAPIDDILYRTAGYYGISAVPYLIEAWKLSEKAMDYIPFEFTYNHTNIASFSPSHGFDVPVPEAMHADTPAWESDRRAYYLITHDMEYHPWALENAALKFKHAGDRFNICRDLLQKALDVASMRNDDLAEQLSDMTKMVKATLGRYYYFTEALLAFDIRTSIFQRDNDKLDFLLNKFEKTMCADIINQDNDPNITEKYKEFNEDYKRFFECNFKQEEGYWAKSYILKIDQRF